MLRSYDICKAQLLGKSVLIDLCFCPSSVPAPNILQRSLVLVIDVLRASATMCALVESGASQITVCHSIEDAVLKSKELDKTTACCIGERGGIAPVGFFAGNSPLQIRDLSLEGRQVFYATTNGTRMLNATREAALQLIMSFGNVKEVMQQLPQIVHTHRAIERVLVCCSGNDEGFSLEDSFFAGAFITRYIANGESHKLTDAALAAVCIANAYNQDPSFMGRNARHARLLRDMGFVHDVEFCLQEQQFRVIPECVELGLRLYH